MYWDSQDASQSEWHYKCRGTYWVHRSVCANGGCFNPRIVVFVCLTPMKGLSVKDYVRPWVGPERGRESTGNVNIVRRCEVRQHGVLPVLCATCLLLWPVWEPILWWYLVRVHLWAYASSRANGEFPVSKGRAQWVLMMFTQSWLVLVIPDMYGLSSYAIWIRMYEYVCDFLMDTWRNTNVIITLKRHRYDVIMTLLSRRVSLGMSQTHDIVSYRKQLWLSE